MSSFPNGDSVENPQASPKFDLPDVSTLPDPPGDVENTFKTRCVTGVAFIKTIHGILNFVLILTLVLVLISAGVADGSDGSSADDSDNQSPTSVKVSAVHTRNSVLVFAAFGLVLVLFDTILQVTGLIRRFPSMFELGFIVTMLILAVIFLILGCCAAAWEKKMRDKLPGILKRKGAAASASFWLFIAMICLSINYGLRLTRRRLPKFGR